MAGEQEVPYVPAIVSKRAEPPALSNLCFAARLEGVVRLYCRRAVC